MYKVQEINVVDDTVVFRDMTAEEIQETELAIQKAEEIEALKANAEAKKASAQAKLQALGLTPDDLKALGL